MRQLTEGDLGQTEDPRRKAVQSTMLRLATRARYRDHEGDLLALSSLMLHTRAAPGYHVGPFRFHLIVHVKRMKAASESECPSLACHRNYAVFPQLNKRRPEFSISMYSPGGVQDGGTIEPAAGPGYQDSRTGTPSRASPLSSHATASHSEGCQETVAP